jgi:tricorn protease
VLRAGAKLETYPKEEEHLTLAAAALLTVMAGAQAGTPQEMRLLRWPDVHGENVYFTHASDLWIAKRDGGIARRLTTHANTEAFAHVSPDGKWVAFTASYDGNNDVYVMPSEGGEPTRLTFEGAADNVIGWTPDGMVAYVSTAGSSLANTPRLWLISPKGGLAKETPVLEIQDGSFSPDGKKIAYHRVNSHNFNWRRYRGGTQGKISIYDFEKNSYTELPSGRENSFSPMWIENSIYYISDKDFGTINLFRYDLGNKRVERLTDYKDSDIKWPSTDGKTIVFEQDGYLRSFDVATKKMSRLDPRVVSDNVPSRPQLRELGNEISHLTISPSGVRLVAEARGEVFSIPVKNGDTRNLTQSSGARERFPSWSPDGKSIAYASDKTGEWHIYVEPQLGGEAVQLTSGVIPTLNAISWAPDSKKIVYLTQSSELRLIDVETKKDTLIRKSDYGFGNASFSPDSKWIAYVDTGANLQGRVFFYEIATGKSTQVTEGYYGDNQVVFDLSGKYLYLVSARTIDPSSPNGELDLGAGTAKSRVYVVPLTKDMMNPLDVPNEEEPSEKPAGGPPQAGGAPAPKDVKIDFDGFESRMVPILPVGNYQLIDGQNDGLLYLTETGIWSFSLKSRESQPILAGPVSQVSTNVSVSKLVYQSGQTIGVIDVRPGQRVGDGRVNTNDVEAVIAPEAEWKQIFWDAWRFERDNFYDPDFAGMNWRAIGEKYERYLPHVRHRSDLSYVLGLLIGELGTSHSYLGGGDLGTTAPPVPVGHLGADYEAANGKIRIKKIIRGESFDESTRSPLVGPGSDVKAGDYLLEIDGHPLDANTNPHSLLLNKANKYVTLTVNSQPSLTGARKVRIKPIASETALRYTQWVEDNRKYVEEKSGGRLGYMHVPNTSFQGAQGFVKGYFSNSDKEGLVVDERFNGGGFIPTFFVERLQRRSVTYFRQRNGADIGFPVGTVNGPKAMLINGYAGSGGDHLPWLFKEEKLGPLIGTRTWGGLVGITGQYPLVDGGSVTSPEFGLYDPVRGEWIAENEGIEPDIVVDARPDLIAKGIDPQLDKAIEYLMKELEKQGPRKIKRPEFRKIPSYGG